MTSPIASLEPMELLPHAWCSSAIQVFEPAACDTSIVLTSDKNLNAGQEELKSMPQWKVEDLKSWIWVQQAMHPELDYDLCFKKKWFSRKILPWKGISIKKWLKEMKQKRKEEDRLRKAEVHAAISVAGIAAALAAIAVDNGEANKPNAWKDTAVASAAALVAAQCAQVAEAAGAKREQLASAITAAMTATDPSNIITLTAAAATSMKGAATLRGRPGHKERNFYSIPTLLYDDFDFDFDFGKCRASLAKGNELLVRTRDGKCKLRLVSVVLNNDAKVALMIKKIKVLMSISTAKESIIHHLHDHPPGKPIQKEDSAYSIRMTTSQGLVELKVDDFAEYKRWIMSINYMLKLSTTISR